MAEDQTVILGNTLTSQVRDIVYSLGQQGQAETQPTITVTRARATKVPSQTYSNVATSALFVFVYLTTGTSPTTSHMYIAGAEAAQAQHLTVGQGQVLAGVVNPNEQYYIDSTASSVTILNWTEYVL